MVFFVAFQKLIIKFPTFEYIFCILSNTHTHTQRNAIQCTYSKQSVSIYFPREVVINFARSHLNLCYVECFQFKIKPIFA